MKTPMNSNYGASSSYFIFSINNCKKNLRHESWDETTIKYYAE